MNAWRIWMVLLVGAVLAGGCDRRPPEPQVETAPARINPGAGAADDPVPGEVTAAPADDAEVVVAEAEAHLPVADVAVLQGMIAEAAAADQVLVIDFWATWCPPCVAMFPTLHAELHGMGDAVRPITVTFDDAGGTEPEAIAFLKAQDAMEGAYILSVEPGARGKVVDTLGDQWNMLVVPAILVFDRDGKLAGEFFGGDPAPILELVRKLVRS